MELERDFQRFEFGVFVVALPGVKLNRFPESSYVGISFERLDSIGFYRAILL